MDVHVEPLVPLDYLPVPVVVLSSFVLGADLYSTEIRLKFFGR